MDAKRILDHFYSNPPAPNFQGNPDVYLSHLIRFMRILGVYFDASHFPKATKIIYKRFGVSNTHYAAQQCGSNEQNGTKVNRFQNETAWTMPVSSVIPVDDPSSDQERNEPAVFQETDVDNFVPRLLRENSGIVDDQELADVLSNGKDSRNSTTGNQLYGNTLMDDTMPPTTKITKRSSSSTPRSPFASILQCILGGRFYALLITCVAWANVFRCVLYIGDPRITWASGCSTFLFFVKAALHSSALLISCWRKTHFSAFFLNWHLLFADLTTRRLGLRAVTNHTNMKLAIALLGTLMVFNITVLFFIILSGYDSGGCDALLLINGKKTILTVTVSALLSIFCSMLWKSPLILIVVICRHVSAQFAHFRNVLKLHIEAAGGHFPPHFKELRERYLVMCNLTATIDKYMKMGLAVIYSMNIVLAILMLYQVISNEFPTPTLIIMLYWVGVSLFNVLVITYNASKVHTSMKSVMYEVQTLQTSSVTPEQLLQYHLFMSKLNDPCLGFTVLGMIVVKKELIFTFVGVFITYVFVLLQFRE